MYVLSNFDLLCLYYTWQEKGFHKKNLRFFATKNSSIYICFTVKKRESVSICKTTHFPHKADRLYIVVFYETRYLWLK